MTEHTPSPQSVVVPVDPTDEMWGAGERAFDRDPDMHHETVLANIWSAMLAAAPAPSSLAGGVSLPERLRFAETWDLDADQSARDRCGVLMLEAAEALERAALSPEAPARKRVDGQWEAHTGDDYAVVMLPNENTDTASIHVYSDDEALPQRIADALNALTPRHEAPARNPLDPDAPSEAMIDAGLKVDWSNEDERGTVINVWYAMNAARRHEAREGEALEQTARQLAYVHAYHSARKNCSNPEAKHETWSALASKQSERDWERFLPDAKLMQEHTHPAAPSADKLRIALVALGEATAVCDAYSNTAIGDGDAEKSLFTVAVKIDNALEALAAMEAEGA